MSINEFSIENRINENDIKKHNGPYNKERIEEIIKEVKAGTNCIVFYHDNGIKEITPLKSNKIDVRDDEIYISFIKYPDSINGQLTLPFKKIELITEYKF